LLQVDPRVLFFFLLTTSTGFGGEGLPGVRNPALLDIEGGEGGRRPGGGGGLRGRRDCGSHQPPVV